MAQNIDLFDSYSTGNLNGNGGWSGSTNFQVETTQFDTSPNGVSGSGLAAIDVSITLTLPRNITQNSILFKAYNAATNVDASIGLGFFNGATEIYRTWLEVSGADTHIRFIGASDSNPFTGLSNNAFHLIETNFDKAGNQARVKVDGGSYSSFVGPENTWTQIDTIKIRFRSNTSTNTLYIDTITDDTAGAATTVVLNNFLLMGV